MLNVHEEIPSLICAIISNFCSSRYPSPFGEIPAYSAVTIALALLVSRLIFDTTFLNEFPASSLAKMLIVYFPSETFVPLSSVPFHLKSVIDELFQANVFTT